jgi:glyoxylase-like metal-dependent hydrolase (beta-lactamase superfamily II)
MCEELLPGLFKIKIPLPNSPLKYLNSYIVLGPTRFLIIDTGMNRPECLNQFLKAINYLKLDMDKADFFITHMHSDHVGLLGDLVRPTSKVYFNGPEIPNFDPTEREKSHRLRHDFYIANGYPEKEYQFALANNPGILYGLRSKIDFIPLKEGNLVEIGDYCFKCIETPGHSPGHLCLYESGKKILISGDHILNDITPHITWWPEMENPLDQYFKSLIKVDALEANLVLPGHRVINKNHHDRIKEIRQHHQKRLDEVILALEDGEKTAFQIASKLSWDIKYSNWEGFPPIQKYFAVGEAIAHIKYLQFSRRIECFTKENQYFYTLR